MKKNPTYREQYDKLSIAYLQNKVNAFSNAECFVGNLLNGQTAWMYMRDKFGSAKTKWNVFKKYVKSSTRRKYKEAMRKWNLHVIPEMNGFYTPQEIMELEYCFLKVLSKTTAFDMHESFCNVNELKTYTPEYEDGVFEAFQVTLEALKQLHIRKGEDVDAVPTFRKRNLRETSIAST